MKNRILIIFVVVVFAAILVPFLRQKNTPDYKDAVYLIDGKEAKLGSGLTYFGNELQADINSDGREDVVFLLTQETGGSGTFFYVVSALNTEQGYIGSDGYFLGDRIAPQTTELSRNPRHKDVVVVNYADRGPDESMADRPSVGKSVYLKLDPEDMRWGIVEPDFEGESNDAVAVAGSYEDYAPEKLARAGTGDVILFFHASWCPSCRGLGADIEKNLVMIPSDLSILKVDYDTQPELKKKYGITYQHTLVQVDKEGNMIKKWSGSPTLASLISQIN